MSYMFSWPWTSNAKSDSDPTCRGLTLNSRLGPSLFFKVKLSGLHPSSFMARGTEQGGRKHAHLTTNLRNRGRVGLNLSQIILNARFCAHLFLLYN
jgi:hypothetical protein